MATGAVGSRGEGLSAERPKRSRALFQRQGNEDIVEKGAVFPSVRPWAARKGQFLVHVLGTLSSTMSSDSWRGLWGVISSHMLMTYKSSSRRTPAEALKRWPSPWPTLLLADVEVLA